MLSKDALPFIQATLPVVKEHGAAITGHFYKRMFTHQPELKNLFNMGNQASGDQAQALAGAVYGYASNLGRTEITEPILNRIAHKHVSLGITPAQYTIVGRHLIASIGEVLGEAATKEILSAWDEAYWLMATDLIAREARIYQELAWQAGQDWDEMTIIDKQQAGDGAMAIYLRPSNGSPLRPFSPGQYISVGLDVPALGLNQCRQYSLSQAAQDVWRITVKREQPQQGPAGNVSNLLHDAKQIGDTLRVGPPAGEFVLHADARPVYLISAGIGITPVLAMLQQLLAEQSTRKIVFAHASQSQNAIAHWDEVVAAIDALENGQLALWLDQPSQDNAAFNGRMDLSQIGPLQTEADFYLCGPLGFMAAQRQWLLAQGVAAQQIHYEAFGPDVFGAA
ncbi:globin domain-containing protein [Chitinibacter sp. SCUT-21]|uniref:globin domain-containing protein n=1 Tax=Chitinibacter sp. SCUT-21 TaxID=2970891 RepID=UPI0035A6D1CD